MNRIRTSPRNEIQQAAAKAAIGVNVTAFIVLMICTVIPAAAQESRMYGHCGDLSVGGSPDLCVYDPSAPQTPLAVYPDTPLIRGLGSVSPDGTRIVFNEGYSSSIIYVADIDGSNKTSLGINGWYPTWSPDGLQIVYAGEEFYPNTTVLVPGNISVFELASSQTRVVAAYQSFPLEVSAGIRWSPDGDKIAFAAGGGDNVDLY
ncbi:MAG: PD40 domain-containing protein, partial [Bacteroidetes bacterium]|nr:PD40 domain-containing protein [Bacteroidota bacterium]